MLREFTAELSSVAGKFSMKVQTKVDAGVSWYGSSIEAAVYGLLSGFALWILILIGVGIHSQGLRSQRLAEPREPANADSRVDKIIG